MSRNTFLEIITNILIFQGELRSQVLLGACQSGLR